MPVLSCQEPLLARTAANLGVSLLPGKHVIAPLMSTTMGEIEEREREKKKEREIYIYI